MMLFRLDKATLTLKEAKKVEGVPTVVFGTALPFWGGCQAAKLSKKAVMLNPDETGISINTSTSASANFIQKTRRNARITKMGVSHAYMWISC
jgi:hypothetical protein